MTFAQRVELHRARGCSEAVAIEAARLAEARSALRRWDEVLHPRNRVGEFMETDERGNPRETVGGGGFVGSRLPAMTSKQVAKMLRKAGYQQVGHKGSHALYRHPTGGRKVTVPMHGARAIPRGTLRSIMVSAGAAL